MIYFFLFIVGILCVLLGQAITKENFTEMLLNLGRTTAGKMAAAEVAMNREQDKFKAGIARLKKRL